MLAVSPKSDDVEVLGDVALEEVENPLRSCTAASSSLRLLAASIRRLPPPLGIYCRREAGLPPVRGA